MKAIYRIIIAAATASLALVSCSKELNSPDKAQTGGLGEERVITLTFEGSTKSEISGLHPSFRAGDKVLLSNGSSKEECTVSIDSYGNATVTTTLTGTLKAVYPASAAATSGNSITGISVPSTQHGTFAEANIAMAENITPGGMARFKLKTAVLRFYVDVTIGVQSITVTSGGADIASDGGGKTISVTPDATIVSDATTLYDMTADHPDRRVCYVAVLPGVAANDLTFTSVTTSQGTVTRYSPGTATLAVKGMYDAFIPYYIKIHIGPGANDYQKWGYCNIGAFLPEEPGKYYPWADTEGHYYDGTTFDGEISWNNYKYASGPYAESSTAAKKVFTKYVSTTDASTYWNGTGSADNKLSMEPADDAAFVELGENWHIPTCGDFSALASVSTKSWNGTDMGYYFGTSPTCIFLPAAGYAGNNSTLTRASEGLYWSSTLTMSTDYTTTENKRSSHAFYFGFSASLTPSAIHSGLRPHGMPIRPIYKTPADPLDIGEYDEPENIE